MDRPGFAAVALLALLTLAAGCVGGQSGTESGGGKYGDQLPNINMTTAVSGCACALAGRPAVALRGRVVRIDGTRVRVRVRALLGEGPNEPELRVAPGDEIGGEVTEPGCEPTPPLHPGDDVAVLHMPGAQIGLECPEYRSCMSQRCDQLLAGDPRLDGCEPECQAQTRGPCATRGNEALLNGRIVIARWGGELSLPLSSGGVEGQLRVAAEDVTDLLDAPVCQALFTRASPDGGFARPTDPGIGDPGLGSAADE